MTAAHLLWSPATQRSVTVKDGRGAETRAGGTRSGCAELTGCHPDSLRHILLTAAALGVFAEQPDGRFTLTEDAEFPPGDFRHGYFDWTVPRKSYLVKVDALRPYVPEHASSLAALAVKFAIHDPGATTAITSMHVEEYARMNIAAADEDRLPDDLFWKLRTSHRFEINLSNRDAWALAARDEVARIGTSQ